MFYLQEVAAVAAVPTKRSSCAESPRRPDSKMMTWWHKPTMQLTETTAR